MIQKMCIGCGNSFTQYNSLQRLCGLCQFNKYGKPKKPMKRIGKVGRAWIEDRAEWVKNNPPDDKGYWYCYIDNEPLNIDELRIDHVSSRTRRPDLRREQSNFAPICNKHNKEKGSLSLAEYKARL